MKINIKSPNITVTDAIRNYIESKTKTFERPIISFLAETEEIERYPIEERKRRVEAFWEVGSESSGIKKGLFFCKVQIKIPGRDKHVKAETSDGDLYKTIDDIKDIVTAQIVALKSKPASIKERLIRQAKREVVFDPSSKPREKESRARDESA